MLIANVASALLVLSGLSAALPKPILQANNDALESRASKDVNPAAVTGTTCTDKNIKIDTHDMNVATLAICGGIAGSIQKCGGAPKSTTGVSGTAKFTLNPTTSGAVGAATQADVSKVAGRAEPAEFEAQTKAGPDGSDFENSAPFRVNDSASSTADSLIMLEGAYEGFVKTLGWRSSGPSFNEAPDTGSYSKINVYSISNVDSAAGLGKDMVHQMTVRHEKNSNETPLHTRSHVGHHQAQETFKCAKDSITFGNVDKSGHDYKVKSARAHRYMGYNIMPPTTLSGKVDLTNNAGSAEVTSGEEASLVVANTSKNLIFYNGFQLAISDANKGCDYAFNLTEATVAQVAENSVLSATQ
ncbi:hypothetical protein CORC01_05035 [Colletotrichum orchidophilum]|uniref:Uncharacterized protein n=1 Tax=Colletotrichum orchidophilum TaxID=1209926 RepID=A0A1G4BE60_9PEZI|nr:uncharacterized protein CORC01_05035 [Colletotrichum orchidophilum]OHE99677.1 hypothetical protein CORC01_05035 [Colletotrichum orchidophilum]